MAEKAAGHSVTRLVTQEHRRPLPISRKVTKRAGLGTTWSPRELRHSFVSIMSDQGVPIETIADLVGHAGTSVTEKVYRHQLKPVITKGAQTINTIFGDSRHG
ncbi:tyrosine-type recombinase/integrase [Nonomuraea sp. NPDC049309]|uniref:tyrosine-type recombinase/integrase n=1 Tax=Nonomuraea sp. NPDC049309 TaxID=3364350 RepID=UPI00371B0AD6